VSSVTCPLFLRQCLCCFKEYKHLEVFNQLVYALINLVIAQISSLRDRLCSVQDRLRKGGAEGGGSECSGGEAAPGPLPRPSSPGEDEPVNVERDSAEEDAADLNQNKGPSQQPCEAQMEALGPGEGGSGSGSGGGGGGGGGGAAGASSSSSSTSGGDSSDSQDPFGSWSTEEREKLLLCAAKIFQIQFPLYTAYKHNTHPTIEVSTHTHSLDNALFG